MTFDLNSDLCQAFKKYNECTKTLKQKEVFQSKKLLFNCLESYNSKKACKQLKLK